MNLSAEHILGIIQLLLTIVVGIVGWAVNRTLQQIESRLERHDVAIESHTQRLDNVDVEIARMTERQGHVQALIAEKIDRVHEKIDATQKMISQYINEQRMKYQRENR